MNPKSSKLIDGKKITIVLSAEATQALNYEFSNNKEKNITRIIEKALLLKKDGLGDFLFQKIIGYMKIHNKVYADLNATFSNLNQISHHLNLCDFLGQEKPINDDLLNKVFKELKDSTALLSELRILILKVHIALMECFGTKEEKTLLEKKFQIFLKRLLMEEAIKRGLIEEYVIEELSSDELKKLIEEMEDF